MGKEEQGEPLFFEFRNSPVRGIPLEIAAGQRLNFGFVEVGCMSVGKRRQLRTKRQLFRDYWRQEFAPSLGVDWMPRIYRMAAHFEQDYELPLSFDELEGDDHIIDSALRYDDVSSCFMDGLDDGEINYLVWCVRGVDESKESLRAEVKRLLDKRDGDGLFDIIVNRRDDPYLGYFRGMLAERIVQVDLRASLPIGMSLYRNGEIRHINDQFDRGAEIDGILTFYSESTYTELLDALEQMSHLTVAHRWQ